MADKLPLAMKALPVAMDLAKELTGLSSAKRLYKKYYAKGRKKPRLYKSLTQRLAPEAITTTRQSGQTIVNNENIPLRNLEFRGFTWPTAGSGDNQRLGSTVKVSGIKICETFANIQNHAIEVHYAIIQPRHETNSENLDFFRSTNSSGSRSTDFVDLLPGGLVTFDYKYNCMPINPDKWHVLLHEKKMLSFDNDSHCDNFWRIERYINLKGRRFAFSDSDSTEPVKPLYRVFWWNPLRSSDWGSPAPNPLPTIEHMSNSTIYFRPNFT